MLSIGPGLLVQRQGSDSLIGNPLQPLLGWFLLFSAPGILFGYAKDEWHGAILGGIFSGIVIFFFAAFLFIIYLLLTSH